MAKYLLINATLVNGTQYFPGDLIDSTVLDPTPIQSAGGILWDAADPLVAAAAAAANNSKSNRGSNEITLELIMRAGVTQSFAANLTVRTYYQSQAAWYIDPVSGDDTNPGLTAALPIKTMTELLRRVSGRVVWIVSQNTVVYYMNHTPAGVDKCAIRVRPMAGSQLTIQSAFGGTALTMKANGAASTFSAYTARNRATNTAGQITDGAVVWTSNLDQFVFDVTAGTWAVLNKNVGGGAARITDPIPTPDTSTFINFPVYTQGTMANGHTYQVYEPIKVNFSSFLVDEEVLAAPGATNISGSVCLWGLRLTSTNVFEISPLGTNGNAPGILVMKLCRVDTVAQCMGVPVFIGCSLVGGAYAGAGSQAQIFGGSIKTLFQSIYGSFILDGDLLLTNVFQLVSGNYSAPIRIGTLGVFDMSSVVSAGNGFTPGAIVFGSSNFSATFLWGSVGVTKVGQGSALFLRGAVTWVNTILASASFTFVAQAVGFTADRTNAGGSLTGNVACTWANVDAAPGVSMFDLPSGAHVTKAVN